jgi:FKBP-type peptidyl-prolyl cis-trans isomerase SlyD
MATRHRKRRSPQAVAPDTVVRIRYAVYDAEDECVGESEPEGPRSFLVGYGELLPALEQAILGLAPGSRKTVSLDPAESFGQWRPDSVIVVDRDELPAELEVGDRIEAERPDGTSVWLKVLDLRQDEAMLDSNHPLAGQKVRFEVEIEGVRRATRAELSQAVARVSRRSATAADRLVPPGRLLRHGSRR